MDVEKIDLSKINLSVGGTLPGEQLVVAVLTFATKIRESQDPEIRKKWDEAAYNAYRDWNNFMVGIGWPGTKLP